MSKMRLLLPFTYGVDGKALDHMLLFAKRTHTTLVALALIPVSPQQPSREVRLERIQQAQDFLEMIHTKALYYEVSLERHEDFSSNILASIISNVQQLECQGILLLLNGEKAHFLEQDEAQQLQKQANQSLYILHMVAEPKKPPLQRLFQPFIR